jgi:toxic protein SymE
MRKATVGYSFRDNIAVPMIRLRGKWLKRAGFEEGTLVEIAVSDGRLTLTVTEPQLIK